MSSALPKTEDQVLDCRRGSSAEVLKLHQAEERLCVLPSGSAKRDGEQVANLYNNGSQLWAFVYRLGVTAE